MLIQVHINLKLIKKFLGGHGQKGVWPVWSRDSKVDCISRMNRWSELIFGCWCKFRKAKIYFNDFWVGVVKNVHGQLVPETLKSAVSYE